MTLPSWITSFQGAGGSGGDGLHFHLHFIILPSLPSSLLRHLPTHSHWCSHATSHSHRNSFSLPIQFPKFCNLQFIYQFNMIIPIVYLLMPFPLFPLYPLSSLSLELLSFISVFRLFTDLTNNRSFFLPTYCDIFHYLSPRTHTYTHTISAPLFIKRPLPPSCMMDPAPSSSILLCFPTSSISTLRLLFKFSPPSSSSNFYQALYFLVPLYSWYQKSLDIFLKEKIDR